MLQLVFLNQMVTYSATNVSKRTRENGMFRRLLRLVLRYSTDSYFVTQPTRTRCQPTRTRCQLTRDS